MSDENVAVDALSILESSLDDTDLSYPILEPGVVDFVVSDAKLEPTRKGTGSNLVLKLKTTIPWKDTTGKTKGPGFAISTRIFIPSGPDVNPDAVQMSKQRLKQLKLSATGSGEGKFGNPTEYIGKIVTARITVRNREDTGEPQNDVQAFVKRT